MQANLWESANDCIFKRTKKVFKSAFLLLVLKMFHLKKMTGASMRQSFTIIIMTSLIFSSCRKELNDPVLESMASSTSSAAHMGLTVDAGPVRMVVYPDNTTTKLLGDGWGHGKITFKWKQVSGNSTVTIDHPDDKNTKISNLKPGVYTFCLTATDRGGISRSDTTSITVLKKMIWYIESTKREALVHFPSGSGPAPVIFAFHGHGGSNYGFAEKRFELAWPKAIVVYPQGLPTKSHLDEVGKKSGWQHEVGEVNNRTGVKDQDIKFFDAMLSTFVKKYDANADQIFVHGWSNGGSFIYDVLWPERGNKIAAISSAAATVHSTKGKKRLPVMQIAGKNDPLVKFIYAEESVKEVRNLNECISNEYTWAAGSDGISGTRYWSPLHTPVIFLQYNGGHDYPSSVAPFVVKFFKMVAWRTNE